MADIEQPLLKKKAKVYPNCPGCKTAYLQDPDAKLPYKELSIVAALTLTNALPISSLYPFLYFMVRDFHVAKSEKDIGFYAGYIGSVFMLGRFATSVQWGMVADKYGRKPVMIIGVISVIILHTLFGASTTFWMAVLSRFLLGSFNGMLGTVKAYASEICSERHQALSVSIVGTTWGLGLIIGPAMGGYLSQPAIKYPNVFTPGSLFDRFPYLLPSLCVTVLAFPVLYIAFFLPETLHRHDTGEEGKQEEAEDARDQDPVTVPSSGRLSRAGSRHYTVCEGLESPTLLSPIGSYKEPRYTDWLQHQGSRSQDDERFRSRRSSLSSQFDRQEWEVDGLGGPENKLSPRPDDSKESQEDQANATGVEVTNRLVAVLGNRSDNLEKKKSLLRSKPVVASIALYCIWALHDMAYTEIFSLWCVSPASYGGLNLTTNDVGQVLAISGFTMLIFQILAFAPLVNWMGAILMSRIAAALTVVLMAAYPFMPSLHGVQLWVVLLLASIIKYILATILFTGCFLLVNNSVTQDQRGAANGVSMSAVSLFKAIGPAGGGSVFAWAQSRQDTYILPGNQLVFFSLGAIAFVSFLTTFEPFFPQSLDRPMAAETEE